jgi:hypothetical protein
MKHSVFAVWMGVVCLLVAASPLVAEATVLVKIDNVRPEELHIAGFVLDQDQTVSIDAIGFRDGSQSYDARLSSAWILNADTREEIWSLEDAESDRRSRDLREYKDEVKLEKGRYEVYYATFPFGTYEGDFISWFKGRSWGFDYDDFDDASDDFEIVIEGNGKSLSERDVEAYHKTLVKGAIVSRTQLEKNHYETIGLKLDRDMDLQIYAIGELTKDGNYDCSWIIDTNTREKVWELTYWDTERAGGAKKNRLFMDTVTLPKGDYALFVATDDSHDSGRWNSAPPSDPYFWGVTIQAADPSAARYAKVTEYDDLPEKSVIVQLTRLDDSDFQQAGFSLSRDMKVRVYAIGEGGRREMYDYSRIVNADTREVVWEMEARDTEHAGGAEKNRVIDEVIELPKGNYYVYAVSDDSHSYRDWNASPPHDQAHWGITVLSVDGNMRNVSSYDEKQDKRVLVSLIGIGDNAYERERFELKKSSDVTVYALGEGSRGRMYDYAWIENDDTGDVVWEMRYRKTDHAGGAKKNRVYDHKIHLDAGKYVVFYESDGSHSFGHWNASPPADAFNWGITVRLADAQ